MIKLTDCCVCVCCGSFCVEEADIFWFHTSFSRQICQDWEHKSQLTGRSANQTWHIQKQNASQHIVDSRVVATSQIECVWEPEKDQENQPKRFISMSTIHDQ